MSDTIGPLDLEEIKIVSFDFTGEAPVQGSLVSAGVEVTMKYGADDTPAGLLVGMPTIEGMRVLQRISGAGRTNQATYHLRCRAVDDDGEAHVQAADLLVKRL